MVRFCSRFSPLLSLFSHFAAHELLTFLFLGAHVSHFFVTFLSSFRTRFSLVSHFVLTFLYVSRATAAVAVRQAQQDQEEV